MICRTLVGTRFGRLVVIEKVGNLRKCVCDCGGISLVAAYNLTSGNTRSCGCLRREVEVSAAKTHGAASSRGWSPEYIVYHGMIQRCHNPKNPSWKDYGGRGIRVCDEWRRSFEAFYRDMGVRPAKLSIERVDNYGDYEKSNCVWAGAVKQARNKRSSRILALNGVSRSLAEWAEYLGVNYYTIHARLKRGWTPERALSVEVHDVR